MKRPLTRSVLERRISEVQTLLDDAVARKAFQECAPLQDKLEGLVKQRADLPTIEELREAVRLAEEEVANAAARRDFTGAATAQAALDKANERLEDAMVSEGDDAKEEDSTPCKFQSRADLEEAITEVSKRINNAIEKKEFNKATEYQTELDELEKLRPTLPSIDELEARLKEVTSMMNEAIKNKNFKDADALHKDIDDLEKKLEEEKSKMALEENEPSSQESVPTFTNETGDTIIFENRHKLVEEINRYKALLQSALDAKKFKDASRHQQSLDKLEALKSMLPTAEELGEQLTKKKAEMNNAIQNKDFENAEKLNEEVETLERKLEEERKHAPVPKQKVSSAPVVIKAPIKAAFKDRTNSIDIAKAAAKAAKSAAPLRKMRPVSKLRPKAPLTARSNNTVLAVTQMLASKRGDAAIITDESGGLAGIITDTDVTRRVVAKHLPASSTRVSEVMTANPSCVSMSDPATDALVTMVENRFRHLPVTDDSGAIVGVLDIAKCLNDAISKLEKSQEKGSSAAEDAVKQMASLQGAGGNQVAALQALLGPLLSQAFSGQSSPTLRTILAGKPSTIVSPRTTLQETGMMMAEARKAALVVDSGALVGIFGFKDMMSRAIAKELPLDLTAVSTVMTPNPESVSPDTTVIEALQIMHDNKFLTLPVCESNGNVIGIVDVMDCVYASGGAEGWRSIFSSAMECDDVTETGSVNSHLSGSVYPRSVKSSKSRKKEGMPVSKLRPKPPMVSASNDTVLAVTQMLASKRGDAAIITDESGGLAGIITDTDVTRRVVAKHLPASSTRVSEVMTANPSCVSMSDPATDALVTMVENRFRHLPVTDDSGAIVGVLDIAKCLNDAISKLEKSQEKGSSAAEDAVKQMASLQGAGGNQVAALQALLGPLLSQAFSGQSSPTLRTILAGKPSTIVSPRTTLQETGMMMAEARKAALVVDSGALVGIFGFKDMMSRAIAKELPLDLTAVSTVMTPNPESVSPDTTVIEALQIMHDNKFLTLPVCESNGNVIGIVDVMDCVYASGGAEGWRSIFSSAMECDDVTETGSVHSHHSSSVRLKKPQKDNVRPVSKLRPKKPILQNETASVLAVTQMLASKRGDAAIITSSSGGLAGIITDTDVTRRVVAKQLAASSTIVSSVMTANPTCVSMSDSAMDALVTMVENRFRHLPVTDDSGAIVGVLDIAKCLNDAITKLERTQEKNASSTDDTLKQMANLQGAGGQAAALQALLAPLLAQALGGKSSPTLRSVLAGKPSTIVSPRTTLQETGAMMADARKAALVVEDNVLVGIFGFKDMMTRAIAKELPLELTPVSTVMTPNPESVSPETTVLEALQIMHDNKFLTLPVCEEDGGVVGLVDVLDCVHASGGADGWRSLFDTALDQDDVSSVCSDNASLSRPVVMAVPPNNIPTQVEVGGGGAAFDEMSVGESLTAAHIPSTPRSSRKLPLLGDLIAYKVVDGEGHTYVIRAQRTIMSITEALEGKVATLDPATTVFKYFDEDGDEILIKSDECVDEAVRASLQAGNKAVKLSMKSLSGSSNNTLLLAGGAGLVAAVALGAMMLLKPKN